MNGVLEAITNIKLGNDNIPEICRYAGYGSSVPDEKELKLIESCMEEINEASRPACVYKEFTECDFFSGKDIFRHIEGCHTIILMGATIGAQVDACIRRAAYRDVSRQLFLDACASTLIEELCDTAEASLRASVMERGDYLTGRFSPGYGDMPVDCQGQFVAAINAGRMIGLTVSGSGILIPSKSVTAVMGVSSQERSGIAGGCGTCGIRNTCYLRKLGKPCKTKNSI